MIEAASIVRIVKMEDRKRASDHDESAAPPLKRQATMVNGEGDKSDVSRLGAVSSPWQVELDNFQKDALIRQMRELKRDKAQLETQLAGVEKRAQYHDEHLRIIDAWLIQLVDSMKVLVGDVKSIQPMSSDPSPFISQLFMADVESFQQHLNLRSTGLKEVLSGLYAQLPQAAPDTKDLQLQVARLLSAEKQHVVEFQKVMSEQEQLSERLQNAAYRYMVAEKKLDKSKSVAVAMLEIQNQVQSQSGAGETSKANGNGANGVNGAVENGVASEASEAARKSAIAVADKRKEQLEALEAENKKLTEQLTVSDTRLHTLTDDDYAKSELFKSMKSQYEDVIKRINNLEATNVQLREEAQKLQAERSAYRIQVDEECRTNCSESEGQLARMDLDLQRIRAERDLIHQQKAVLEGSQAKHDLALREIQALHSSGEDRLRALESEVERLRLLVGESLPEDGSLEDLQGKTEEELRKEIASLRGQASMLNTELSSMQSAFTKTRAQANKKASEISSLEEQVERYREAKQKIESTRFSERNALDTKKVECENLRRQGHKSGEIIAQLKESENKARELCTNLEKQLAEYRDSLYSLTEQNRMLQQHANEAKIQSDGLQSQMAELKEMISTKDLALSVAGHAKREAESEVEALKVELSAAHGMTAEWKEKLSISPGDEMDMYKRVAYCGSCQTNIKDTYLKTCGHILCKPCVTERVSSRSRKCPHCLKPFGINDHAPAHMV